MQFYVLMFYNREHQKGDLRNPMKHSKQTLSAVLAVLAVLCFLAAGAFILRQQADDRHSRETANALRDAVSPSAAPETPAPSQTPAPSPAGEQTQAPSGSPEPALSENPYLDSFLANDDMAAWLQIPGTVIDYPVMWTPGDENYYLRRDFDGSSNQNGCLILDTDSCIDPLTTNLIIHGHNMKSGAMFGTLAEYESEEYFKEHREIDLYTPACRRRYEVIAVFRSQVYKKTDTVFKFYKFFQADTQEEFDDFYNNIKEMSLYDTGVTAQFGDRFLTLSTCSYHVDRGRFVVVARETQAEETYLPIERPAAQ